MNLRVSDLAQARRFYGELLLLDEIERPGVPGAAPGAWYRAGAQQLHLTVEARRGARTREHVAFSVADLDRAVSRLRRAGIDTAVVPLTEYVRQAFVRDPDGHLIELTARTGD